MNIEPGSAGATSTKVLIVGGGPVGLTLAIDLAQRGVNCILVDAKPAPEYLPKMERCNARTMEIFRRLGLADQIRSASFPADARMDISVTTRLCDEPLVRLNYPTVAQARQASRDCRDGTLPLEPYQVVSQYTLEPLLKGVAETLPGLDVRFGWSLMSFGQDADGVRAVVRGLDDREEVISADYLVGCDGGRSTVRKQLGIELEGDGGIAKRNQVFFRSGNLFELCPWDQCRMYFFANSDQSIMTVQDDLEHFSFHTNCFGSEDDIRALMYETFGLPIDIEIITAVEWTLHLLVAKSFGEGRVLLAGDAVKLIIPSGGLGLNTGIGDATDLAWKLAAATEGWGGPKLVESYAAERLPIARRNRESSRYANAGQREWRAYVDSSIHDDTAEGRGVRRAVAYTANVTQRRTHEMTGTELGYRYEDSPVIATEDGRWPPDVAEVYIPTARPGARLPHVWLADGSALHDRLGSGFTLLSLSPAAGPGLALVKALGDLGAPIEVLAVDEPEVRDLYEADLLLIRPDLHVAWRGDTIPADPARLAALVTGN
jgi:2-polyprenyl-6-methoxyphenol hydroxylase-like FAD-dependent oxidoreductase